MPLIQYGVIERLSLIGEFREPNGGKADEYRTQKKYSAPLPYAAREADVAIPAKPQGSATAIVRAYWFGCMLH